MWNRLVIPVFDTLGPSRGRTHNSENPHIVDQPKWNCSILEAKRNESWKLVLTSNLDPKSSTASNEICNHFEMIVPCIWHALVQFFMICSELRFYSPTVASVTVTFLGANRGLDETYADNDVNFLSFAEVVAVHCITHR